VACNYSFKPYQLFQHHQSLLYQSMVEFHCQPTACVYTYQIIKKFLSFWDMRSKERQCEAYLVYSVREMFVLGAHGLRVLDGLAPLCGGGLTSCL
jgi:hypothetical protein